MSQKEICIYKYRIVPEICKRPGLGKYESYAIYVSGGRKNVLVHDVSVDLSFVRGMVKFFSRSQPMPIHLYEIIHDMLP